MGLQIGIDDDDDDDDDERLPMDGPQRQRDVAREEGPVNDVFLAAVPDDSAPSRDWPRLPCPFKFPPHPPPTPQAGPVAAGILLPSAFVDTTFTVVNTADPLKHCCFGGCPTAEECPSCRPPNAAAADDDDPPES